jgi:hypothetical protein
MGTPKSLKHARRPLTLVGRQARIAEQCQRYAQDVKAQLPPGSRVAIVVAWEDAVSPQLTHTIYEGTFDPLQLDTTIAVMTSALEQMRAQEARGERPPVAQLELDAGADDDTASAPH